MMKKFLLIVVTLGVILSISACSRKAVHSPAGAAESTDAEKAGSELDVSPFFFLEEDSGEISFDIAGFEDQALSICQGRESQLKSLEESFKATLSDDLQTVILIYDQALSEDAGLTLTDTEKSLEAFSVLQPPNTQAPEVL